MSNRTLQMDDSLYAYLLDVSLRESELLVELRERTARMTEHSMQIAPEQGQFMALLLSLMGARRCIEVGVFTGYSSLVCARALPADGYLLACDVSEEWTAVAREFWRRAGVRERIELRLAPALETLDALLQAGDSGSFDFAFIDADKANYVDYYERCLALIRPGGLIAVDNVLWSGDVARPEIDDPDTAGIRQLNHHLRADRRVDLSLVPIADGLTLARKRDDSGA